MPPNQKYVYLGVLMGIQLLLTIAATLPLALIAAYSTDTVKVVNALMRILFYLSGIFFCS